MKDFAVGLVVLLLTKVSLAQPGTTKTITVLGSAEREVIPDEIYVQVSLQEYINKSGIKVSIEKLTNEFPEKVRSAGIDPTEISVSYVSGYHLYNNRTKKAGEDLKGSVVYIVKLKTPEQIKKLIERIDDAATGNISISRYGFSGEKFLMSELRSEAVRNAEEKARSMASAINMQIGEAIQITENGAMQPARPPRYDVQTNAAGLQRSDVSTSWTKMKFRSDISASFALAKSEK